VTSPRSKILSQLLADLSEARERLARWYTEALEFAHAFNRRPLRHGDPQAVIRATREMQDRLDAEYGTSPATRQAEADRLIAKHLGPLREQAEQCRRDAERRERKAPAA
jgi:hypothetical protein